MAWLNICTIDDIIPNGGVCALVDHEQVAVFRVNTDEGDLFYGIANYDPFSKANVISRGLVGCMKGEITVASPIYKNHFSLSTGLCLEDGAVQLKTWPIRLADNQVQVQSSTQLA